MERTTTTSWPRRPWTPDFNFDNWVAKDYKMNGTNYSPRNFSIVKHMQPSLCTGIVDPNMVAVFISLGCLLAVICLVGIVANITSIVVFSRMPQRSSTTFLIQMLAVADSAFLVTNLFTWTMFGWFHALGKLCIYLEYFSPVLPYLKGMMEITRDYAVWMVAIVTLERYIAIYYPLSMCRFCRVSVMAKILTVLLIYDIAFNIPSFMQWTTKGPGFKMSQREHLVAFSLSSLHSNFVYNVTYYSVDSVMNLLLPVFVVLVLNFRIIMVLKRARTTRSLLSRNSNEVDRGSFATVMLVIIAIVFVLCELPKVTESYFLIWSKWERASDRRVNQRNIAGRDANFLLFIISTLSQAFNSFVNFFVYCLTARRFRKVLKKIIPLNLCKTACYRKEMENEATPL